MKLSIIIVHYKRYDLLKNLLVSLESSKTKDDYEIIIVDNDEVAYIKNKLEKEFTKVKYICSQGNVGYAKGNNFGAKQATGEYLFFLNPDTKVINMTIEKLIKYLDNHEEVAIVAPELAKENGEIYQQLGTGELTPIKAIFALSFLNKVFPKNKFSKMYWQNEMVEKTKKVDTVQGSAFMIRRNVFEEVNGFDENFFLFFEENDLCKRVKEKGYQIAVNADVKVIHYWKASTPKSKEIKQIFKQSRKYYFKKHYGQLASYVVELFVNFGKKQAMLILLMLLVVVGIILI